MFNDVLNKQGLTIERLRRFCEMVEAGSIAKAVEQNDREQPAYSRDLKTLEDYFEEDLFKRDGSTRSGKALQGLTLRGDLLHRTALRFFADIERIINYNEAASELTIAAEKSVMHALTTRLIGQFKHEIPDSKIHLKQPDLREILPAIISQKINFAVAGSSLLSTAAENISTVLIGNLEYKIYAPDALAESNIEDLPISTLESTEALLATVGLSPTATLPSHAALTAALHNGSTAVFLPDMVHLEGVHEIPLSEPCRLSLSLAWNTLAAEENPYIASVASMLETLFKAALQP